MKYLQEISRKACEGREEGNGGREGKRGRGGMVRGGEGGRERERER